MEEIPLFFLDRKHLWVDKDLKPTDEWERAEFIMEGSSSNCETRLFWSMGSRTPQDGVTGSMSHRVNMSNIHNDNGNFWNRLIPSR